MNEIKYITTKHFSCGGCNTTSKNVYFKVLVDSDGDIVKNLSGFYLCKFCWELQGTTI
jgi:hypothetical protein